MNKIRYITLFVFAFGMITSSSAFAAGGEVSSGGGVMKCQTTSGEIWQLLDLYEGKHDQKLSYPATNPPDIDPIIKKALTKIRSLDRFFGDRVAEAYAEILTQKKDPPAGMSIAPPSDTEVDFFSSNCMLLGAAQYHDARPHLPELVPQVSDGELYMDSRILAKLDPLNLAALWIHESVYKVLRERFDEESSEEARLITAFTMSKNPFSAEVIQYLKKDYILQSMKDVCDGSTFDSIDVKCDYENWRITIQQWSHECVVVKTTFDCYLSDLNCRAIEDLILDDPEDCQSSFVKQKATSDGWATATMHLVSRLPTSDIPRWTVDEIDIKRWTRRTPGMPYYLDGIFHKNPIISKNNHSEL